MATRKTTTKAKTKTTKKPAASARTAAAKTTSKTKSTKVSKTVKTAKLTDAKVTAKSKVSIVTADTLRRFNLIKAFVFAALAVAAGVLMNSDSYAVNVGYQAKDELLSLTAERTAFVSASQAVMDVQVRWLVIIILGLAAVLALLAATRWRRRYETALTDGVSSLRWIGLGITTALMVEVTALLSGVSDIFVLKILAGLMVVTCALGWVSEKRNKQAGRSVWSEYVAALFTGALPWLLILGYAVSTWIYGLIRYPWYVYALYAALLIGFTLIAVNQYKRISGWKNYLVVERNYLLIGLATKTAFAAILILGFQK